MCLSNINSVFQPCRHVEIGDGGIRISISACMHHMCEIEYICIQSLAVCRQIIDE